MSAVGPVRMIEPVMEENYLTVLPDMMENGIDWSCNFTPNIAIFGGHPAASTGRMA